MVNEMRMMATILAYTSPALATCCRSAHCWPRPAAATRSMCGRFPPVSRSATARLRRRCDRSADRGDRARRLEGDESRCRAEAVGRRITRRAAHEVSDLADAVTRVRPDALLVDVNCWGALSTAEAGAIPWACFSPYTPPLRSRGVPPFGLGLKPLSGVLGRVRDAAVRLGWWEG